MSDLIDRQSALAKAYTLDISDTGNGTQLRVVDVEEIERLPAVQPEMIRCRDCRWNDGTAYCEFFDRNVKGGDFCSWAELPLRRKDGGRV